MKLIKSFPIADYDAANKFMAENPPRSTEKQSGIIFHNGFIAIIYDDGKDNPNDKKAMLAHLLEGDREKRSLVEHSIEVTGLALAEIVPKGYKEGMSKTKFKELLAVEGKKDKEGKAYIEAAEVDNVLNQITNLENTNRMDKHEYNRLTREIKAYETQLAKLNA